MRVLALGICIGWLILGAQPLHAVPIGIANHNPGNIRSLHPWEWRGSVGADAWDHVRFKTDLDGLRAMQRILWVYYYRRNIHTVSGIANRWARKPQTAREMTQFRGYLLAISQHAMVSPNARLWLSNHRMMAVIAKAIVYAENGEQPYSDSLYRQAFGY